MCKIAILTSHDPDKLQEVVLKAWRAMSSTEKDGYGAAWVTPDGKIGYIKSSSTTPIIDVPDYFKAFSAGSWSKSNGGPLLIHGRTATCGVNADNTHPMIIGNSALIHNGIVNSKRYHNVETTCDSELLLHAWKDNGIISVAEEVTGYYAFGALTASKRKVTLDIVRDDKASLCGGSYHKGMAFATTRQLLDVIGASFYGDVKTNVWFRYVNGKHILTESFVPKKDSSLEAKSQLAFRYQGDNPEREYDWPMQSTNWRGGSSD